MQRLDHPNVMKLLDYFEDDKNICMVMELMVDDMRNLTMMNPGAFEENFAKSVFRMMLESVEHCHQN